MWLSWLSAVTCCSLWLYPQAPCGSKWLPASPGLCFKRHSKWTTWVSIHKPIMVAGNGIMPIGQARITSSSLNKLFAEGQEDSGQKQITYLTTCPSKPHLLNMEVGLAPQRSFRLLLPGEGTDTLGRSNQHLSTEEHCTKGVNIKFR